MMNPEQNESFGINASIASEENANYAEENGGAPRGDPEEVVTGVAPSSSAPTTPVKNQSLEAHDTFTSSPTASEDNSDQRRPSSSRRQQRMRLIKCYALVAVVVIVLAVGIPLAAVYLFKDNDETSFNGAAATAPTEVSSSASDNQEPAVDVTSKPETPVIETDAPVVLEVTDSPVVVDTTEDETIEDDDTLEETPVETDAPLDEKNVTSTPEDVEEDMEEAVPEVPIEEDATDETTAPNNEETAIDAPNNQETATDAPNNQDTATDAPNNQETATDAPTDPVVLTIPPTDPNAESGPDRSDIYFELIEVTRPSVLEDSASPQALAHKWLVERDQLLPVPTGRKLIQRYALNVLDHVVRAPYLPVFSDPTIDECQWMGVTCNEEGDVIELRWNEQQLTGSLSAPEMKLLDKLEYVDMSGNSLTGDLENVYDTTSLKHIYLHHNKLSGSISERVGLLGSLESLNLQKNE